MKILTDIHTHTVASGHAHSTLMENINCAAERGVELIAITDHDIHTTSTLDVHYFGSLKHIPRIINGVTLLKGVETNILDETGKLGVDEQTLDNLDIVIASCHPSRLPLVPTFVPDSDENFLKTYKAVMLNPQVDILGHITICPHLKYLDKIIDLAKSGNKLIEINNSHFINPKSVKNVKLLIDKCMEKRANIVVSSDAHFCTQIGDFNALCRYFEQINFPENLIINRTKKTLFEFLDAK